MCYFYNLAFSAKNAELIEHICNVHTEVLFPKQLLPEKALPSSVCFSNP